MKKLVQNTPSVNFFLEYWTADQATFEHATFADEIWKTISNLEFRKAGSSRKHNFSDFRRAIAALVKTAIFLGISGFFTRNLM